VSEAGDGDRERLRQTSKTGEGRAPVCSGQLEPGDGGIAAVPTDDLPGEGVGLRRPGDSQLITSRPNNAEGVTPRACGTAAGEAGSAWMPATAGCWLAAHVEASDPSDDPSPAAASSAVVSPIGSAFVRAASRLCWSHLWGSGCEARRVRKFGRGRFAGESCWRPEGMAGDRTGSSRRRWPLHPLSPDRLEHEARPTERLHPREELSICPAANLSSDGTAEPLPPGTTCGESCVFAEPG